MTLFTDEIRARWRTMAHYGRTGFCPSSWRRAVASCYFGPFFLLLLFVGVHNLRARYISMFLLSLSRCFRVQKKTMHTVPRLSLPDAISMMRAKRRKVVALVFIQQPTTWLQHFRCRYVCVQVHTNPEIKTKHRFDEDSKDNAALSTTLKPMAIG